MPSEPATRVPSPQRTCASRDWRGCPQLTPADPASLYRSVQDAFEPGDLAQPFAKLARLLADRWRAVFNVPRLNPALLADHLQRLAATELGCS